MIDSKCIYTSLLSVVHIFLEQVLYRDSDMTRLEDVETASTTFVKKTDGLTSMRQEMTYDVFPELSRLKWTPLYILHSPSN